jgi:Tol biopolymer transport system component
VRTRIVGIVTVALTGVAWAQVTERESVSSNGTQGDFAAELPLSPGRQVSADGRYVVFFSASSNLVGGDMNGTWDVFLRDRLSSTTELVSVGTGGNQGNGVSGLFGITISPDGRFVAFESRASNLVPGDTNAVRDVFLRDRLNGTTERVSVATGGAQGNEDCLLPSISSDGRYVAFTSNATNLVVGDTNGTWDIFVRDRQSGTTERVSIGLGGVQGTADSYFPCISADGRWVTFESRAANLVPGDTNGSYDVFVRDRHLGAIERVSVATGGTQSDLGESVSATISSDGRYVAFLSSATNLVPGDTNGTFDVFLHDRRSGTTERVSVATSGAQGNGSGPASISEDGRYVAFGSYAPNLIPGGSSGLHIFVRDRIHATTEIVSVTTEGAQPAGSLSELASISGDGRYVVFRSYNRDLVQGDSNGFGDVFLHDRAATGFTSFCDPGMDGVIGCPCSNPPSAPGRGCDNSSATGGALLSASGIAYLSIDSLVFTTSGEKPNALSILMQGASFDSAGVFYGQGVRCAGGPFKRLYTKAAVGGSITAPDLGAGDPTVSSRLAAMGAAIQPGQGRGYLVYYRDPLVLGGCDAWKMFNATQTGLVSWWP